jgi:2-iminoacetate synthase ThiH
MCRAKPNTSMQNHPEPSLDELLWTVAAARIMFGPAMNIQAPPNLTPAAAADTAGSGSSGGIDSSWRALLDAGINDWGEDHHQQQQQQQQQQTFIKGDLHLLVACCQSLLCAAGLISTYGVTCTGTLLPAGQRVA